MEKAKIDVAVLILFFNRPAMLAQVFEQVKQARPSKLYFYQDGPRADRPDDVINIQKCRDVVSDIDWECEVHRNYQETNRGCDPSGYLSRKWVFAHEEMAIILEDDCVPSQSFFSYCKELLEKYKDDQRVDMICGMNNCGVSKHCPYDYLFSVSGSVWGWATWKRVVDEWKENIGFVEDEYACMQFHNAYKNQMDTRDYIKRCKIRNNSGRAHFEEILCEHTWLHNRLHIVPSKNMISNIGFTGESTHSVTSLDVVPKGIRKIFNMKTYEYDFPLKHPPYMIEDMVFLKKINRIMGTGYPLVRLYRKCESVFYRMRNGDFSMWKRCMKKCMKRKKRNNGE